ncbi:hypothetical protein HDU84_002506 [Entophlyctis sp. JEL0112]|nr:hypothetical protein HDU84_002506 [Entophlyctis sp. JEL0112]
MAMDSRARLDELLANSLEFDDADSDSIHSATNAEQPPLRLFADTVADWNGCADDDPAASAATAASRDPRIYEVDSDEESAVRSRIGTAGVIVGPLRQLGPAAPEPIRVSERTQSGPLQASNHHRRPSQRQRKALAARRRVSAAAAEMHHDAHLAGSRQSSKSSLMGLTQDLIGYPDKALALHKMRFSYWLGRRRCVKGEAASRSLMVNSVRKRIGNDGLLRGRGGSAVRGYGGRVSRGNFEAAGFSATRPLRENFGSARGRTSGMGGNRFRGSK